MRLLSPAPAVAVELAVSGVVPRVVAHLRSPDAVMQKKSLSLIALLAQEAKARESLHDLDFSLLTQFLGAENQKLQSMACSTHQLTLSVRWWLCVCVSVLVACVSYFVSASAYLCFSVCFPPLYLR